MESTPLKPYPAYKPAGVPWLQQVPEHWEVLPNRALFTEVKESGRPEDEMLSVTIGRGVLKQAEHLANSTKKDSSRKDRSTYKRAAVNDIVYNKMRAWQGAFGMSRYSGIVSPAYVVQRPTSKSVAEFYHYVFRSPLFAKEAERNSYGLASDIWNLRPEHFKSILNICPPIDEQHLIVRYLHTLDAKVKRYIRTKRSLIARLQEQKQAIIQRAVTRGLDPNVKLKPSGVEWLGEVPEHWMLRRFKFVAQIRSGQVDPRQAPFRSLVLIAPNHIQSGTGKLIAQQTAHEQGADSGKYLVEKGEVVYSKIRPNLRKATIAQFNCLCSADMYPITPAAFLLPEYLLLIILSPQFTKFAVDTSMRAAMPKINREDLANCWLWFPEPTEQRAILDSIESEGRPYDAGVANSEKEIQLMLEYHTRLIADVVTGAVDVREAAKAIEDVAPVEDVMDEALELEAEVEEELDTNE